MKKKVEKALLVVAILAAVTFGVTLIVGAKIVMIVAFLLFIGTFFPYMDIKNSNEDHR